MTFGKKLYFFYKHTKKMEELAKPIIQKFVDHSFSIVPTKEEADIIISIGGDNAFLQATRKTGFANHCYYVGINIDRHGFYTDFTIDDIDMLITQLNDSTLDVIEYPLLEVIINQEKPFYCINECTIRSNVIKTFVLDILIDDEYFETFRGDGIIVATPSGSTAYNKSARGAVIDPSLPSIQVTEVSSLNNNQYRTLGNSFLLSPERTLTVDVVQDGNDHPIIAFDNEALGIKHARHITLSLSNKTIRVLKVRGVSFWNKVQQHFIN